MTRDSTMSATPPPPPVTPLPVMEYDTPRADLVSRGKFIGVLVLAAVFGAMLLGLLLFRMGASRQSRAAVGATVTPSAQRAIVRRAAAQAVQVAPQPPRNSMRLSELLTNTLGPTQIVYEEEPLAAKRLRNAGGIINQQASRDGMSQPLWGAFEPPAYRASGFWENGVTNESRDALLFSHALTSPGGNARLVMLEMDVKLATLSAPKDEYKVAINRRLKYRICDTTPLVNTPQEMRNGTSLKIVQDGERNVIPVKWVDGTLRAARPSEYNLRFFAGQPDPKDPSHFTVEYEINGVKNTIDGWLTDDDFLRIVPRGGVVDKSVWNIDAVK